MQHPAQAGTWEAGIADASGSTRIWKPLPYPSATAAPPTPWTNGSGDVWRLTAQGPSAYKEAIGIDANGSISCFFHWRPGVLADGAPEPVPEWASFLVTTTAHGSANSSSGQNDESRRDLAKEHVTVTAGGKTLSGGDVQSNTFAALNSKILLLVKTNGDADIKIPGVQLRATASLDGAREYWMTYYGSQGRLETLDGYAHAGLDYRAQEDVRRVWISSSDIETSYFKSDNASLPPIRYHANTPPSGPGPYAISHLRNADGSMQVTSALNWLEDNTGGTSYWTGHTWIHANEPGFLQPQRSWGLSQGTHQDPVTGQSPDSLTIAISVKPAGPKSGAGMVRPSTLATLTTTDLSDGAVGKNTYGIDWRLPIENAVKLPLPSQNQGINYGWCLKSDAVLIWRLSSCDGCRF